MKKMMFDVLSRLLRSRGMKIVPLVDSPEKWSMREGLKRAVSHGIPISTVIDIGASNGKWSAMAMDCIKAKSYFAIEPLKERKDELEQIKHQDARFDYALCVAGASVGEVEMAVSDDLDGSTVNGNCGILRRVPVQSLDEILTEQKLPAPFLLKFDTHGYELPILEGASKTLQHTNVIIMEVYNFNISEHAIRFPQMCQKLESLGFQCYDMAEPMLRRYDQSFWQMDLFFARKESSIFSYQQYR